MLLEKNILTAQQSYRPQCLSVTTDEFNMLVLTALYLSPSTCLDVTQELRMVRGLFTLSNSYRSRTNLCFWDTDDYHTYHTV